MPKEHFINYLYNKALSDKEKALGSLNLLLDQAKLLEGIPLDDSKMFCDKLNELILENIE